jgi:Metal binding domain of Ada
VGPDRPSGQQDVTRIWKLIGPDGKPFDSDRPGSLGGHRRSRIYGRLDCPAAKRAIARGGYVAHRVFFLNEDHAKAAGYRPCAACLPEAYANWKAAAQRASNSSQGRPRR